MIRIGRIYSKDARFPYSYFILIREESSTRLGHLTTFNFYAWDSHESVQVSSSTSAAYFNKLRWFGRRRGACAGE